MQIVSKDKIKLFFFLPKRELGGAEVLFIRIITELVKDPSYEITLCDYPDGVLSTKLGNVVHDVKIYNGHQIQIISGSILVLPLTLLFTKLPEYLSIHESTRLFLWDLGAYGGMEGMMLINLYRKHSFERAIILKNIFERTRAKKISSLLDAGLEKSGLAFMNLKDYYFCSLFYHLQNPARYLQIPINLGLSEMIHKKDRTCLNVGWVSRLVNIKIQPLLQLINDLSSISDLKVKLHIIGYGPEQDNIRNSAISAGIDICFPGKIEFDLLSSYITTNIDIGFSMGTAALEFARHGVPTVLTNGAHTLKKDKNIVKKYKWIFDDLNFNLAAEPSISNFTHLVSINQVFNDLMHNYKELSFRCRQHVELHHNIKIVLSKFTQIIAFNTFTFKDVLERRIYTNTFWDRILLRYVTFRKRFRIFLK